MRRVVSIGGMITSVPSKNKTVLRIGADSEARLGIWFLFPRDFDTGGGLVRPRLGCYDLLGERAGTCATTEADHAERRSAADRLH